MRYTSRAASGRCTCCGRAEASSSLPLSSSGSARACSDLGRGEDNGGKDVDAQTPRGQPGREQTSGVASRGLRRRISQCLSSLASNFACRVGGGQGAREGKPASGAMVAWKEARTRSGNWGWGCNGERLTLKLPQVARPHPGWRCCSPSPSRRAAGAQCPASAGLHSFLSSAAQTRSAPRRPVRGASGRELRGRPSSAAESRRGQWQRRPRGSGGRCCGLRGSTELGGCLHVLPRTI